MKVLIAYLTQTGNTAKVAHAICEAVSSQGNEAALREVSEVTAASMNSYGLVFLGSTCYSADLADPVKRLLEEVGASPSFKLAGFVTHATQMPDEGEQASELYERWAGNCIRTFHRVSADKGIAFLGYFHCQGAPSPPIEAFIHSRILTDEDEWAAYIAGVRGHPDDVDLEKARAFALQVLDAC